MGLDEQLAEQLERKRDGDSQRWRRQIGKRRVVEARAKAEPVARGSDSEGRHQHDVDITAPGDGRLLRRLDEAPAKPSGSAIGILDAV